MLGRMSAGNKHAAFILALLLASLLTCSAQTGISRDAPTGPKSRRLGPNTRRLTDNVQKAGDTSATPDPMQPAPAPQLLTQPPSSPQAYYAPLPMPPSTAFTSRKHLHAYAPAPAPAVEPGINTVDAKSTETKVDHKAPVNSDVIVGIVAGFLLLFGCIGLVVMHLWQKYRVSNSQDFPRYFDGSMHNRRDPKNTTIFKIAPAMLAELQAHEDWLRARQKVAQQYMMYAVSEESGTGPVRR